MYTAAESKDLRGDQTFFQASSDDNQVKGVWLDVIHVVRGQPLCTK